MLREKEKKARTPEKIVHRPTEKNGYGLNGYRPTEKEPFMNERQREYFRAKLLDLEGRDPEGSADTLQHLQDENVNHPDLADRASSETDRAIELRARDRQRKLIAKIDAALQRHRRRHLRLLRGDRRADLAQASRSAPDRDAVDRGAGAPRAPRAGVSGRLKSPSTTLRFSRRPGLSRPFCLSRSAEKTRGLRRGEPQAAFERRFIVHDEAAGS